MEAEAERLQGEVGSWAPCSQHPTISSAQNNSCSIRPGGRLFWIVSTPAESCLPLQSGLFAEFFSSSPVTVCSSSSFSSSSSSSSSIFPGQISGYWHHLIPEDTKQMAWLRCFKCDLMSLFTLNWWQRTEKHGKDKNLLLKEATFKNNFFFYCHALNLKLTSFIFIK